MTIHLVRDLNGHAAHVHDGRRIVHITDPDTPERAREAAERWLATATKVLGHGGYGKSDEKFLETV